MENEITTIPCDITPATTSIDQIRQKEYTEYPIADLPNLGIAGQEMLNFYNSYITPGGEGLYKVTFPKGVDGTLSKFKKENAYLGSIKTSSGFSQARLTQVSINPEQVFMALALMNINEKLSSIMETQAKILDFMYAIEETKITAGIKSLDEELKRYKYNWNIENYIQQELGNVIKEKVEAKKSIELYKRQINDILSAPKYPHTIKVANQKVTELNRFLYYLYSAYYLLEYATFFECVLLKNFSTQNIESIRNKMSDDAAECYSYCRMTVKRRDLWHYSAA